MKNKTKNKTKIQSNKNKTNKKLTKLTKLTKKNKISVGGVLGLQNSNDNEK
jgi:hypothetical protein